MLYVRQISRMSGDTARQAALISLPVGIGIPVICIAIFAVFGLAAAPFIGPSAWEPADSFIGDLSLSATAMPAPLGLAVLLLAAVTLPAVAGFGRWCLSQAAMRPAASRLPPLLRRAVALASSLRVPAGLAPHPSIVRYANSTNLHSPQRTLASTSTGLSGASPLLE